MKIRTVTAPFPPACEELARRVEEELARFLGEQREEAVGSAPGVHELFDEVDRVIASGGKRLRPVFCLLGLRAAGGEPGREALRAAAALELLHTFAIVHDDVMDASRTRRGEPASWVHLAERHRHEGLRGGAEAYGISAAILVGDLALILADRALLGCGFPEERLLPAIRRYNRMRTEVVAGQYLDVLAAQRGDDDERDARRIAALKSGGYTVEGPLHIGAALGGGSAELMAALSAYGLPLGEAFQLRDDVLGVFGDPEVTGKDRDSDLREGKRTVLVARASAAASPEDRAFVEDRLGAPDLARAEVHRLREIVEETGALSSTQALIEELAGRARSALEAAALPEDVRDLLRRLVETVTLRSS